MQLLHAEYSKRVEYVKDDKSVFYEYEKIEGADVQSFKVEQTGKKDFDAYDKNRKYRFGEPSK
jgi:DKNYY family